MDEVVTPAIAGGRALRSERPGEATAKPQAIVCTRTDFGQVETGQFVVCDPAGETLRTLSEQGG